MNKWFRVITTAFLIATSVYANEEKHEEAKPSEGAHGAEAPSQDQKALKELMDLEKQVTTNGAKIAAKEHSVHELIKQKQQEKNPEKLNEIIKLLQKEHRELNELIKEHSTQLGVLQYRYPERGITLKRAYKRFNSKSLEEMEKSIGLEGHLLRSREKVKKVYGVEDPKMKKGSTSSEHRATPKSESILGPSTISK